MRKQLFTILILSLSQVQVFAKAEVPKAKEAQSELRIYSAQEGKAHFVALRPVESGKIEAFECLSETDPVCSSVKTFSPSAFQNSWLQPLYSTVGFAWSATKFAARTVVCICTITGTSQFIIWPYADANVARAYNTYKTLVNAGDLAPRAQLARANLDTDLRQAANNNPNMLYASLLGGTIVGGALCVWLFRPANEPKPSSVIIEKSATEELRAERTLLAAVAAKTLQGTQNLIIQAPISELVSSLRAL